MSMLKIAIVGPESTGKSFLSNELAKHYNCHWVPEFAREYCEKLTTDCTFQDEVNMFEGQKKLEDFYIDKSKSENKKILFCDTMILSVKVWTEEVLKIPTPFVVSELKNRKYDLFLLCNIDMPWEDDPLRDFPDRREYFLNLWKQELENQGYDYTLISGLGQERTNNAIQGIEEFLKNYSAK